MGVMGCYRYECYRYGCENVMCGSYSPIFGYICFECKQELKEYLRVNGTISNSEIKKFMNEEKMNDYLSEEMISDFVDNVFTGV